ncbi:MAG: DUF6029 family protein [Bacteroidales bacterium]|nr:DUF6029 family protein [Bacteroidales bacterium]
MRNVKIVIVVGFYILYLPLLYGQNESGEIHGNFQIDAQSYKPDSIIGAPKVPEKMLLNSYTNLTYSRGNFNAGIRFESYMNALLGYDARYNGSGIPYKFITYKNEALEITAGNFYEQFGNGLILRAYEEKFIGYDNAFEGINIKYYPIKGIALKGLTGKQRNFFEKGAGIVRGIDGEVLINDLFTSLESSKTITIIGGSFVSKYQADKDPIYILPENVAAWASRININHGKWSANAEYAYKINDPSTDNRYIYKEGQALLFNLNYSTKGFGWILNAKRVDNMSFRSDRNATLMQLNINYIPVFTRPFTYTLLNKYPYATQPNGEVGIGTEVLYKFKKETFLGGKYGTNVSLNYNRIHNIDKTLPNDTNMIGIAGTYGYKSNFFKPGKEVFYENITLEINKKFSPSFTSNFLYQYFTYNFDVLRGMTGYGMVYGHVAVIDAIYRFSDTHAIHTDAEILLSKQDEGDWAVLTIEYSIAPSWFFSVSDQVNFNNPKHAGERHFYFGSIAHAHKGSRIQIGYGRQPQGIMCVGGVCRNVPASNGFIISISSTF